MYISRLKKILKVFVGTWSIAFLLFNATYKLFRIPYLRFNSLFHKHMNLSVIGYVDRLLLKHLNL